MAALERSVPQPGPVTGQIKIDMSLITCKQYSASDAERKEMIGAWMSGYKADQDSVPARPNLLTFASAAAASSFIPFTIASTSPLRSAANSAAEL